MTKKTPCDFCKGLLSGNLNEKNTILCRDCLSSMYNLGISNVEAVKIMNGLYWETIK